MAQAGYSGKPLYQKLGFKPGFQVWVLAPPPHYQSLLDGAEGVTFHSDAAQAPFDAVHLFLHAAQIPPGVIPEALAALGSKGMLWLSWPKKRSPLFTGLTEDDLRAHVLPLGWVDTKVCAVDTDWSGLKFLRRKAG